MKQIVSLATSAPVSSFSGGIEANGFVEQLGFRVVPLRSTDEVDLSQYSDHESIAKKLVEVFKLEGYPVNDSRACNDFVRTIRPGDRIIAKKGRDEVVAGTDG